MTWGRGTESFHRHVLQSEETVTFGELKGCFVRTCEGEGVGVAEDLFLAQDGWAVRHVVVKMDERFLQPKVLLPTYWGVKWLENQEALQVAIDLNELTDCPPYNSNRIMTREHVEMLFGYYGNRHFWM
jgi:hypothetical protein